MKRAAFILTILFFASICAAQQPSIRVRLLSLYRTSQAEVKPAPGTIVAVSLDSGRRELKNTFAVRTQENGVRVLDSTTAKLKLEGDFRLLAERIPAQHIHGAVEITSQTGVLTIIALVPMEQYVADVLEGETGGNMPGEALKALAIAIRSYTTRFRGRHKEEGFDFCDTTHCQYLRFDPPPSVLDAVNDTRGELLWDRGSPLAAYYHKDCGGTTEAAATEWPDQDSPALVSHSDRYCIRASQPWRAEIARSTIDRAVAAMGMQVPPGWTRITVAERTPSGRARILRFSIGNSSGVPVSASALRFALGRDMGWNTLKSDWYEIGTQGDHFIFKGRGVGHGVGLCQTGAAEMAREGKTYREILAFYYPGAGIGRSAQGIPWKLVHTPDFDLRVVNEADLTPTRHAADSALEWATQASGLTLRRRPIVEAYPTVAMFRDATGEPGWIAASTRNEHIRMQPPTVLAEQTERVLRHEFLHVLIEGNAKPGTPLWFREGLVVYLGGDPPVADETTMSVETIDRVIASRSANADMRQAYQQAAAMVRDLDRRYGRAKLMNWLQNGLPEDIRRGAGPGGVHEMAR
jgi:stage II sporulation protein D